MDHHQKCLTTESLISSLQALLENKLILCLFHILNYFLSHLTTLQISYEISQIVGNNEGDTVSSLTIYFSCG